MAGLNKWLGIGYAGKDPEIFVLQDGSKIANFNIAVSQTYKSRKTSEKVTNTEWIRLVFYGALAEVVEKYVKKGSQLYVEGKLRNRDYEGKDGVRRFVTEVTVDQMQMFSRASDSDKGLKDYEEKTDSGKQENADHNSNNPDPDDFPLPDGADDLPF